MVLRKYLKKENNKEQQSIKRYFKERTLVDKDTTEETLKVMKEFTLGN